MKYILNTFNIRQMQAYAALCLCKYCVHFELEHISIKELITHLFEILTAKDLPDWERRGSMLDITGRGDTLPESLSQIVPSSILPDLGTLIDCCVEVGIVDMYGTSTDMPMEFLNKCIAILRNSNVDLPPIDIIKEQKKGVDSWGEAVEEIDVQALFDSCKVDHSGSFSTSNAP